MARGRKPGTKNVKVKAEASIIKQPEKLPVAETELTLTIDFANPKEIVIGTNNEKWVDTLSKLTTPKDYGTWKTFVFSTDDFSINFTPKKRKKGKKISQDQLDKMHAARKNKSVA